MYEVSNFLWHNFNPHDAWQKKNEFPTQIFASNWIVLLLTLQLRSWTTSFCTWLSIANFLISLCELCSWNSLHAIKQDLWGYEKNWGSKRAILAKAQFSTDNVVEPSNDPWGLKSLQCSTGWDRDIFLGGTEIILLDILAHTYIADAVGESGKIHAKIPWKNRDIDTNWG